MLSRRACLASLLPPLLAGDPPLARMLFPGTNSSHLGAPSPDGRFLTLVLPATGDLALRDIQTGALRNLTQNPPHSPEFAYFSAVSRDSKSIAYAWFNQQGFYDLRLISAAGGPPRILHSNEERRFVQPCAFTPDNLHILTLFFRNDNISQIALVSTTTGTVKVLKSLDWVYPNKMDLSPEGRFIVYDDLLHEGQSPRGLFLLATDASRKTPAIQPQVNDVFPLFTPDGKSVVFLSARTGSTGLYLQSLTPKSQPQLLRKDMGRALPLGLTQAGDYYYALRTGQPEAFLAGLPPSAPPIPIAPALTTPEWSPGGQSIAFITRAGNENFGQDARIVTIVDINTGKARHLTPKLPYFDKLRWSPDAQHLLAGGSDRHGQRGLYLIHTATSAVTPLVLVPASTYEGFEAVWTQDGQAVIYIHPGDATIRLHPLKGEPRTLYQAPAASTLHDLAISPDARHLAFAARTSTAEGVFLLPLETAAQPRQLANVRNGAINGLEFLPGPGPNLSEALLAAAPSDPPALWRIPLEGSAGPKKLPWNLHQQGPVRVHPSGRRITFTAGRTQTAIWVIERLVHASHHQR